MFSHFKLKFFSFMVCFFIFSSASFAYWPFSEEEKKKLETQEMMICLQYFSWTGIPCGIVEKLIYEYSDLSTYLTAQKLKEEFLKNFL